MPITVTMYHHVSTCCLSAVITMRVQVVLLAVTLQLTVSQFVLALSPSGGHDQTLAVYRQLQDDVMGRLP